MLLDLADVEIRARLSQVAGNRIRLTLDYPFDERYQKLVMSALSDLLRPASEPVTKGRNDQSAPALK